MCPVFWFVFVRPALAILNSPIVIAVISLTFGGVVAAILSGVYQRKRQVFDLRVAGIRALLDIHTRYLHTYLTAQPKENYEDWMKLLTTIRYLKVLFPAEQSAISEYLEGAKDMQNNFGTKLGGALQQKQDKAVERFQYALNDLMKVSRSRLGISDNG